MTTLTVRNDADAFQALKFLNSNPQGHPVKLVFQGWPRIFIQSTERLPGVQAARWITQLQRATDRQYATLKHAGARQRLTAADRRAVLLDVRYHDDGRGLTVDMSGAANALADAVEQADRQPSWRQHVQKVFDFAKASSDEKGTLAAGAVELGKAMIDRARPNDLRLWGLAAILTTGLVVGSMVVATYQLDSDKERNRHQERLAELDHTTIAVKGSATRREPMVSTVAFDTDADARALAENLARDQLDRDPLLRFVVSEAERVRPAMLDLAPATGGLEINGARIQAEAARAVSKKLKAASRRQAKPGGVTMLGTWTTTVRKAGRET